MQPLGTGQPDRQTHGQPDSWTRRHPWAAGRAPHTPIPSRRAQLSTRHGCSFASSFPVNPVRNEHWWLLLCQSRFCSQSPPWSRRPAGPHCVPTEDSALSLELVPGPGWPQGARPAPTSPRFSSAACPGCEMSGCFCVCTDAAGNGSSRSTSRLPAAAGRTPEPPGTRGCVGAAPERCERCSPSS